ncbi:MAG: YabP/YqfC family sporulation protein [Clostridia bacterium]|nr:YabP/YqfC family sporulation protein [Clostridia bacterium]
MENEKSDLTLLNRNQLNVTGVKKIKSSEPEQIVLILHDAALVICGVNLFVVAASIQTGEVSIGGLVKSLRYTGVSDKRKFSFKNMFR